MADEDRRGAGQTRRGTGDAVGLHKRIDSMTVGRAQFRSERLLLREEWESNAGQQQKRLR